MQGMNNIYSAVPCSGQKKHFLLPAQIHRL